MDSFLPPVAESTQTSPRLGWLQAHKHISGLFPLRHEVVPLERAPCFRDRLLSILKPRFATNKLHLRAMNIPPNLNKSTGAKFPSTHLLVGQLPNHWLPRTLTEHMGFPAFLFQDGLSPARLYGETPTSSSSLPKPHTLHCISC